jgi:hypothetical protein
MWASSRWAFDPREDTTLGFTPISLETCMDQDRPPSAQVLHGVRVHISLVLLQEVKVPRLMLTPLLFPNADILVRFALVWVKQEEIGFPRTLGIRDNDFRRNRRRHERFLHYSAVVTTLDV